MQRAVSCVTGSVLRPSKNGYGVSDDPHLLTFADDPVELTGRQDFALSVRHEYRIVRGEGLWGRWKVRTVGYYYELQDDCNDEVISFHWHPESRSPLTFPHMHIGVGSGVTVPGLRKPHYETPRMALETFLLMLFKDFGVQHKRDDYKNVLSRGQAQYEQERTWQYHPAERESRPRD
jgi:hypothetical protein